MADCGDTERHSVCIISASDAERCVEYVYNSLPKETDCKKKDVKQVLMMPTPEDMTDLQNSSAILILITEELLDFLKDNKSAEFNCHVTDTKKAILYYLCTCEDDILNNNLQDRFPHLKDGSWLKVEFNQFSHIEDIQRNWVKILSSIEGNTSLYSEDPTKSMDSKEYIKMNRAEQNTHNEQDSIDAHAVSEGISSVYLETGKASTTDKEEQSIGPTDGYMEPAKHSLINHENYQPKVMLPDGTFSYTKVPFPSDTPVYEYADLETLPRLGTRSQVILQNSFIVSVQENQVSKECGLHETSDYHLQVNRCNIKLYNDTKKVLWTWPLNFIRRYGKSTKLFTFEAGRRCESGPGFFNFVTAQGDEIFNLVNSMRKKLSEKGKGSEDHSKESSSS